MDRDRRDPGREVGAAPENPILVWGAGAMGGSIGAALTQAGHAVRFVDRDLEHVSAMRAGGLEVRGPIAEFAVQVDATSPDKLDGRYDRVLLCVKAHHTAEAIRQVRPHLAEEGVVVSIQNGLNEEVIAAEVGRSRTMGAFVNFGADLMGPGVVHWGGRGAVVLGELDGRMTPRLDSLLGVMRAFEPDAIATPNVLGFLWSKLAYAALLFATALTDESIADALADPRYRSLHIEIAREVCRVAHAEGVPLEPFDGFDPAAFATDASDEAAAASLDDLVAFNRRSAKTHSGIWRDLAVRKRKTEVDAQLGPVTASGAKLGVPTPLLDHIIVQIHEIEDGVRSRSLANLSELAGS